MHKNTVLMPFAASLHAACAVALLATIGCSKPSSEGPPASTSVTEAKLALNGQFTVCFNNKTINTQPWNVNWYLSQGAYLGHCATYGDRASLGDGYMQTYTQLDDDGSPEAIGVEFTESMLSGLPMSPVADGNNCWDVDGDGKLNLTSSPYECVGGYQHILFFPPTVRETPFKWMLINWNPNGHGPEGTYDVPHFDFHFYIMDYMARNFIRPGPCGTGLVNCDDFQRGIKPLPPRYIHPDYEDMMFVETRMGNHLMDLTSAEFDPGGTFTRTFIFGSYDGHVTFWEPMITLAFFRSHPSTCRPIKLPAAYEIGGYYPSQYCIRYRPVRRELTVSLEGFVPRFGSP
jgi:hypothetical protein